MNQILGKLHISRKPRAATWLKVSLLLVAVSLHGAAMAHHSYGMFDLKRDVTVKGTITSFDWSNPHAWIHAMVRNDAGVDNIWDLELGPPVSLTQRGWKRSSLKPGDVVELTLSPLVTGAPGGHLQQVKLADGQVLTDGFKTLVSSANAAAAATPER